MWAKIEERAEFVSKESGGFGASAVLYVGLLSAVGPVCVESSG